MLRRTFATRALVGAGLAMAYATPALAGRGTQIDILFGAPACYLGAASCDGIDISASGLFQTAYIYREGIVSFDSLLPAGAGEGDIDSLGGGTWFTPGFASGANYQVSLYLQYGWTPGFGFNFYTQDQLPFGRGDDENTPDEDETVFPDFPVMQVFFGASAGQYAVVDGNYEFEESVAIMGYGAGFRPAEGSLIGFNVPGGRQAVQVTSNLRVGDRPSDSDFLTVWGRYDAGDPGYYEYDPETGDCIRPDEYSDCTLFEYRDPSRAGPTAFTPLYDAIEPPLGAVPEPATWTMMLVGFGGIGAAIRRRRRGGSLATV